MQFLAKACWLAMTLCLGSVWSDTLAQSHNSTNRAVANDGASQATSLARRDLCPDSDGSGRRDVEGRECAPG